MVTWFTNRNVVFLLLGILFLTVISLHSPAQKPNAFARVSITPREGVVRQPYKVTIRVYSSTWFAKPLQFANLQIDDAFIIPFTRTVSSINYINNKKYATLSFYYLVFPYNTGTLEIPELEISTSIPPEGDYKGQPVVIKSRPQKIKVNPVPSTKNEEVWMVAKNITIKEHWDKPLDNLKVGDVAEREITITASGTLPSLILPLEIEKPELVSTYPKEPVLRDKHTDKDVNGLRIEKYAYLFEKEGEIILPEEIVTWWNPITKRVYNRIIPERKLNILANPDLALMKSLKDSLQAMTTPAEVELEEKTTPWARIGIIAVLTLVILWLVLKTGKKAVKSVKNRRAAYLQSEPYFYKKVVRTLNKGETIQFIRELYGWFDKARKSGQTPAIYFYLDIGEQKLLERVVLLSYSNKKLTPEQKKKLRILLNNLRIRIAQPGSVQQPGDLILNPV
ncbi:MAG: BatD family protein [Bacteroidota bacterium]